MCNKQITTSEGSEYVTMKSGVVVRLHRCNLKRNHKSPCGYIGHINDRDEDDTGP